MIATITLNPSIDQLIVVRSLVKDDANRARSVIHYPGGKGVNVSKVVRELGGKTRAYALVGGFVGDFWTKLVKGIDIPHDIHRVRGETRINTIVTEEAGGTQTRISAPGPEISEKEIRAFLKRLLAVRPKPFVWALGGSLAHKMNEDTYKKFILTLQKSGTPCVLDTDNEALRLGVEAKPFMIKPNEYEMERLFRRRMKSQREYLEAAKSLVERGIRVVVVSLAKRGALFVTREEAFYVSTPQVAVRSHLGAGDSLIGGFLLGLRKRMSLREAARLGVAASTSAVMREAPRLCLKSDIPRLLPRIAIRPL